MTFRWLSGIRHAREEGRTECEQKKAVETAAAPCSGRRSTVLLFFFNIHPAHIVV